MFDFPLENLILARNNRSTKQLLCQAWNVTSNFKKMNLKIIYSLLILINLTSCKNQVEEAEYTNIPGSRILIDMPEGFKLTSGSMGIENDKNSMVQFFDLIGGNHFNNSKTVSKEIFESKGIKVLENKDLKIDNYDAKYFLLQANENEKTINIVFGDSTFSDMVMALYNSKDFKTEKELKVFFQSKPKGDAEITKMQLNQGGLVDGINKNTFIKTPDARVSDVFKRISGASVQDNKFVVALL